MAMLLEGLIVPLFAAALGAAQFVSGVNLVEVYATVTDASGEPVAGLTAADFEVSEDGIAERITAFAPGELPLSVVVAIDRSFSMSGNRLALAKRAAVAFIRALRDEDEVTVVAVGSEIETITPPTPAKDAVGTPWEAIGPWGTSPLYDATVRAIDLVQGRRGRRALVLLSDGDDRESDTTAADLIDHARRSDVLVYPVALGKHRPPVFAEIAGVTGGRSLFVTDPKRLDDALMNLARELRVQYLIGYVPADAAGRRSGWHAIDVRVNRPNLRVRARDGYVAR
jgi:Ca-activated chloride channel family protein